MLVYLALGRSWTHPLLGWPSRLLGRPLDSWAQAGQRRSFLTRIPSVGKESWSAQEGETFGVILVGKDRDHGRISHDVTWWCIVAGSET